MSERPPTRYDEEGKSLPERGSGRPALEAALSSQVDKGDGLREPEKLTIPAEAVAYLLHVAVQNQIGNAWWNGFVVAHGVPSLIVEGRWQFEARDATVVKTTQPQPQPTRPLNGLPAGR